jgi:hypothetical protein
MKIKDTLDKCSADNKANTSYIEEDYLENTRVTCGYSCMNKQQALSGFTLPS